MDPNNVRHSVKSAPGARKPNHFKKSCHLRLIKEVGAEDSERDTKELCINLVKVHNLNGTNIGSWFEKVEMKDKYVNFKLDRRVEVNILPKILLVSLMKMLFSRQI